MISLIVLAAFLELLTGCNYYKVSRSPEPLSPAISDLQAKNKYIILHDAFSSWHLTDIIARGDTLTGKVSRIEGHYGYQTAKPDGVHRWKRGGKAAQPDIINEVHIYTNEVIKEIDGVVTFPVKAIEKIEIYNPAKGATAASWIFGTLGVAAGILIIVGIVEFFSSPIVNLDGI